LSKQQPKPRNLSNPNNPQRQTPAGVDKKPVVAPNIPPPAGMTPVKSK